MHKALQYRFPLAEFLESVRLEPQPESPGLRISEWRLPGQLNVRGDSGNPRFSEALERYCGICVPELPNTFNENDCFTILWLGPNEWLLITSRENVGEIARDLREALDGTFCAVTDVTHNQTVIRVCGPQAKLVLRKGCSLDLHSGAFGPGCCAQTLLAKAAIIIRWVDQTPSFDLIVRRSYSEYLVVWLADAAAEYGLAINSSG